MNQILKYGSISGIPLYNCSAQSPDEWSRLTGVRHPFIGSFDILYGLVINILYVPILAFMLLRDNFRMSYFKIMVFLGVVDMLSITVNSVITGILSIQGAVYCTYPNFNYITGMIILGLWCCSCFLSLLLVVNRLLDITKPEVAKFLFEGNRTFVVLSLPVLYGTFFILFTTPVGFSSKYVTWLFDPLIFEGMSHEYTNIPHGVNNVLMVAITCVLYVALYYTLGDKLKAIGWDGNQSQNFSIQILVQSAMICSINMVASIAFVVMNFVPFPIWLVIIAHKAWQFIHGAPVIIYLSLNKTIQKGFFERMGFEAESQVGNSSVIT